MALEMGSLLKDRFRLLRPLGEGGMGEVYLGEDERGGLAEGRPVAIKSLRSGLTGGEAELFLRRFREESDILKRLKEPGIPAFVDAFEEGDRSFLIMEYIEGHSLASLLERSPNGLRASLVAEVGIQVCRILETLHSSSPRLIHRDIKPSNIIIRAQDELVFLVDFGLAREFHGEGAARTLVGTVDYCPLEQLQGHPEPRSDLYALGATMFELLTGKIPKPLNIPPLNAVAPHLPVAVAEVVDKSVAALEDRYADAGAMRRALEATRRVLMPIEAPAPSIFNHPDRAEEIIQNWGRPEHRLVSSSRIRAERLRNAARRRLPLLVGVLLVVLALSLFNHRGHERYLAEQRQLVMDAMTDGVPGPGWQLEEALGLFPAEGLGLGEPDPRWEVSSRAGCVFRSLTRDHPVSSVSFRLRRLKSKPRLLVFCHPWGLLLQPQAKEYGVHLLHVSPGFGLHSGGWNQVPGVPTLGVKLGRSLEVRLSINGRVGQLNLGKVTQRFPVERPWTSDRCGVVLLNATHRTRCLVENWQVR